MSLLNNESSILSEQDIQSIDLWISKMKQFNRLNLYEKVNQAKKVLMLEYKVIGFGHHRIVFDLENGFVLKVATSSFGLRGNLYENDIYKKCPDTLRKYFCPVREYGNGWLVMEKMNHVCPAVEEYSAEIDRLRRKFREAGFRPRDLKSENIALNKENQMIIIDYGNFRM